MPASHDELRPRPTRFRREHFRPQLTAQEYAEALKQIVNMNVAKTTSFASSNAAGPNVAMFGHSRSPAFAELDEKHGKPAILRRATVSRQQWRRQ